MDEAVRHNRRILSRVRKGDLLEFPRGLYSHWAVYVGNNQVIHLAIEPGKDLLNNSGKDACVQLDSFWTVAESSLAQINNVLDDTERHLQPGEIVQRARMKIGHKGFNLMFTNCEHFVTWCRYNKARSTQVEAITDAFSAFGTVMKAGLLEVANKHPDEEKRKNAESWLALGQVLGLAKDMYLEMNKDEGLDGITPVHKGASF